MDRFFLGILKWLMVFLCLARPCLLSAQDFLAVGARGGFSFNVAQHRFQKAEGFADFDLPWHWDFYSRWRLQPRFELSAGDLNNQHANAFIGTAGLLAELRPGKFPFALEGGSSPTLISRYQFGGMNFGERFQFTTHVGLAWYLTERVSIGYRFEHMSNAGLASPNPGLNLEMLELTYHF
jgi:hypothetical protein